MSVYVSKVNRTGIDWPAVGEWRRGMGVNRLETFAKNLVITEDVETDLLNSVPTPWARLLLFEAALYDLDHPAHADVVDQWRGLLGTIALAELLRLPFNSSVHIDLSDMPAQSDIRNAFLQLRPRHWVNGTDEEQNNWHKFDMISVDNVVIGATSPRTLVFTGISHRSPASIPFQSAEGRLADPLRYYEKFGDTLFLKLLAKWLDTLIDRARIDEALKALLGTVPVSYGQATSRREQLVEALEEWRDEFPVDRPAQFQWPQAQDSPFSGPYSILRPIPCWPTNELDQSDLRLAERPDVFVCYHKNQNSMLVNRKGSPIREGGIKIYDGHWIEPPAELPALLSYLPTQLRVIGNPAAFFEDSLIQAPLNSDTSYSLVLDNVHYLLPYKKEILTYFSPEEILRNTSLRQEESNYYTVTLDIPLVNDRMIKVKKNFRVDDEVVLSSQSVPDALAFWPDTICKAQANDDIPNRYFYYKFSTEKTASTLDFQPVSPPVTERPLDSRSWMETREPLLGFVGSIDQRKGLLLIKYRRLNPPNHNWKVAIDLGSTHTRVFSLAVEQRGDRWFAIDGAEIRPVQINAKVKVLTPCSQYDLMENFFPLAVPGREPATREFVSQLVLPQPNNENHPNWLPREGSIYQGSLLDVFPSNPLRHNFKWNSDNSDYALRAFLRCLLVMVQAQALSDGARIVSVSHSYPSVFTKGLIRRHRSEWAGLGDYSGLDVEAEALKEAEAVGRYLQVEEGAAVTENTIALDVGGSTTDVAIWTKNKLAKQVSIKMAAGVAGSFVQTEAGAFRRRLVAILKDQPFNLPLNLDNFKNRESGFSLMFNAILNMAATRGQLAALIGGIQDSQEGRVMIAHIMYVFGALIYYVGLLSRHLKMDPASRFFMFYCGKGGQLLEWIANRERFVEEMFGAGLLGPHGKAGKVSVTLRRTSVPKEEVGRGLLAESALKADPDNQESGLINLGPVRVLVGEEGYSGLNCFDELDEEVFAALPLEAPRYHDLKELRHFVQTFVNSNSTREAAQVLGLTVEEPTAFRANLIERLFGTAKGRVRYDLVNHPEEALLESLFITEVKVLLETITKNHRLFS